MKYKIYPKSNISKETIEKLQQIFDNTADFLTNEKNDKECIIVIGGDGTFIKAMTEYAKQDIFLLLLNKGKLAFLSSFNEELDYREKFSNYFYLSTKIKDKKEIISINEIIVTSNSLFTCSLHFNDNLFKKLLTNCFSLVTSVGSTGLNRSKQKPLLFPWSNLYIFSIENEPIYHYYSPLLQPVILTEEYNTKLIFDAPVTLNVKSDNNEQTFNNVEQIKSHLIKSRAKVLNLENEELFFHKVQKLL